MHVKLAKSETALRRAAEVLLQLRPHYTLDSLLLQIAIQRTAGYQVAAVELDGKIVCVAGFVITEKLAWGKHLYVDDLVSDEHTRSQGAGKAMIVWLKDYARQHGCVQLHLDSGMHRKDAHRFYDREGFDRSGIHFAIADLGE
jgi:GNAT superfamily N-acetyltransferase